MGFLFGSQKQAAPPPVAPPVLPPKNITIGSTPIDRAAQRRRGSLANTFGQNRTLLNDATQPLG